MKSPKQMWKREAPRRLNDEALERHQVHNARTIDPADVIRNLDEQEIPWDETVFCSTAFYRELMQRLLLAELGTNL